MSTTTPVTYLDASVNPNGYNEPNPPCDGYNTRQHHGRRCTRPYFSVGWISSRAWMCQYNPEARAEYNETTPEYEYARVINRCLTCQDCLAEFLSVHPGQARAIISRVEKKGFAEAHGYRFEWRDLRQIKSRPDNAIPVGDLLKIPSDDPRLDPSNKAEPGYWINWVPGDVA